MAYAVGVKTEGLTCPYIPCGNDGLQRLHSKGEKGWKKETTVMRLMVNEVWVVQDFTQRMCEMDNTDLVKHVQNIGRRIW